MVPKFCKMGDYQPAIKAVRSDEHCREHYNSEVLAGVELLRFEVTAETGRVTDARTQVSHGKGSTVDLDPAETNVAALVAAGLGRVVPAEQKPAAAKATPKA